MLRFGNRLLAIFALIFALGTGAAQAQKFAIINMQQAVLATTDGKKASQAINDKFTPVRNEINQLMKDLQTKQDAFTKNRATMTPLAANAAQKEIESLTTSLKRRQEDAQQDLEETESRQLGAIVPKLQQVINQYAAANQITVVVDSSANPNNLIYADASLNIIAPVITAYEKASGVVRAGHTNRGAKPPANIAPRPSAATGAAEDTCAEERRRPQNRIKT